MGRFPDGVDRNWLLVRLTAMLGRPQIAGNGDAQLAFWSFPSRTAFAESSANIFLVHGKTVVAIAVLAATFIGIFTLLTTALNIAFISGGLLLAPILAGLLVTATRYFGHRYRTSAAENAVLND